MKNSEQNNVIPASEPESTWPPDQVRGDKRVIFLALSGIGNLVMQLPAIRELKKAHPAWHVTLAVAPRGTKALAETEKAIDEIIELRTKASIRIHAKQIIHLRRRNFDIGIVLSPGQLLKSAAYLKLAGIPIRIGNTYPLQTNQHSQLFLTNAIDEDGSLHDIEQNLRLLEPLEITPSPVPYYSLQVPEENIEEAKVVLESISYKLKANEAPSYVGFHAGSAPGFEWKRWPIERYAEVAKKLAQDNPNVRILVFGDKYEDEQKQELVRMINKNTEIAFVVSASLLTTAGVIEQCSLFLTNDSGLMHIAAALDVPTLGLFGPTDEQHTGPRGKNSFTLRASDTASVYNTEQAYSFGNTPHESMLGITTKMVIDKLYNIML